MPLAGRRQHKLCCQSNRANAAINPGMRQQVLGQPVMLLKYSCCSNADLCKAFAVYRKGGQQPDLGEISLLSRVTPQCKAWLHVRGTCQCCSSCCRSKESKLLPWHLFQTISPRLADSVAAPPAPWVTNEGATTSWQAPNEGRRERHARHHKQLSRPGQSLAKGTDVLITLISPENTTWLILHVFSSLEEEAKDKKSVNDTQYSTYLKDTTSRHSCWFHCVHSSCTDPPSACTSESSHTFNAESKGSIYPYEFLLRHPYKKLRTNTPHLQQSQASGIL